ncbi:MAG: B12-binding domain-containing radical SAM protein [Syntrophaceae bacterium]|nr:B12-binding domain-containing radical SAM protein [Syntrophaceae bacterium]
MKVAFFFFPPWDPHFPSYTTALFRGSTLKAGHEFFGFDLNIDIYNSVQKEDKKIWNAQSANLWQVDSDKIIQKYSRYIDSCIEKITGLRIDLYAMSINVYSKNIAFYTARKIKENNRAARIFIGGPQCFPAYDGLKILKNKYVDAICTGEGDLIWIKALDHFYKYGNLQLDVPGLSYKKDNGDIVNNGVPEIVRNLNSIPFADYSDIDFRKYGNVYNFSLMTSRGCINKCAFCSERPNFSVFRFRSAENIYNEIVKHLQDMHHNPSVSRWRILYNRIMPYRRMFQYNRMNLPYISFNDSLLNGVPKELERFCDLVIRGGHKFSWGGMALIRKELTFNMLNKMQKAGCYNLAWGLESGCQEVLDLMNKKFFDINLAKQVIKMTHNAGIHQSISLIAGFPGETEEMFLKTKEFVKEFKDYIVVGIQPMMLVKNSLVSDKPEDFGIKPGSDWLKWQTLDGTNTYDIRLQRVEALRSVLDGKLITIDK